MSTTHDGWMPPPSLPLLRVKPDTRSPRWRAAEARCSASYCPPDALAIVAEEQAAYDAAHPEGSPHADPQR